MSDGRRGLVEDHRRRDAGDRAFGGLHQRVVELLLASQILGVAAVGLPAHGTGAVQPPETVVGRCDGHDLDVGLAGAREPRVRRVFEAGRGQVRERVARHAPRGGVGIRGVEVVVGVDPPVRVGLALGDQVAVEDQVVDVERRGHRHAGGLVAKIRRQGVGGQQVKERSLEVRVGDHYRRCDFVAEATAAIGGRAPDPHATHRAIADQDLLDLCAQQHLTAVVAHHPRQRVGDGLAAPARVPGAVRVVQEDAGVDEERGPRRGHAVGAVDPGQHRAKARGGADPVQDVAERGVHQPQHPVGGHREAGQLGQPRAAHARAHHGAHVFEQADVLFDGGALGGEGRAQGRFVVVQTGGDGELLPVAEEQRVVTAGVHGQVVGPHAEGIEHRGDGTARPAVTEVVQADVELVLLAGGRIAMGEAAHVAAGNRVPVHDDDVLAECAQIGGACQATRSGADDDDVSVHGSSQSQNAGV